ncbi:MAG: Rpn family recombination-promoting nuclease/putative transposase [Bacteroidales bacterium]|nr:Rpn family recombination-promoting nuclease/putative transposase [Bacteroidales bacterium]
MENEVIEGTHIEGETINLLTDFGFKRIFGTEAYKKNLIRFLNAFLKEYIGTIRDIDYRPTEQLGLLEKEKRLIYDVFCSTKKDDRIIVEMQKASQEFIRDRIIAYSARSISNSLKKGDRKYNFPKVISIILVDFELPDLKGSDNFMQWVTLRDDKNQKFSEKIAFVLIDLTKFAAQMDFGQLPDVREKWCYAIKNMWRMSDNDIPIADTAFRELYEECKLSKLSDMEKEEYEKSILEYDDVKDAIEYNRRLARNEGREEGENTTRRLLARNMLSKGLDPSLIAEISGLTKEEVLALAKE